MTTTEPSATTTAQAGVDISSLLVVGNDIRAEIEQFYFYEAELLDDRRWNDWQQLWTDDAHYWMPTRTNRSSREMKYEFSAPNELAHFDDNKTTLEWRTAQLATGMHWAEDPPSRTRHVVSNIRVRPSDVVDNEYETRSNFICYRNRMEDEVDLWAGERHDVLRHLADGIWAVSRRKILLDQNVVLSKNLSILF